MKKKVLKTLGIILVMAVMMTAMCIPAFAASGGDVAGAIESTWGTASTQIKQVVNNVVFPVIDLILAVFFFAKLGLAYFDYRKSGHFEWTAPAILFACLVFTLTAPMYVWALLVCDGGKSLKNTFSNYEFCFFGCRLDSLTQTTKLRKEWS